MSHSNYGGRTGVSTLIYLVQRICKLFIAYQDSITAFINASTLTAPQKAQVIEWCETGVTVCGLLLLIKVTYEQ